MKTPLWPAFMLPALILTFLFQTAFGQVILDDNWSDGDRVDTELPGESAWYASNAGTTPTLSATTGLLTGSVRVFETNAGSRLWITHFTPTGSPVELADGGTLKVSLSFRAINIATAPTTGRGLRVGLFNFSEPGAARVTGDGFSTGNGAGAPGANVTGYLVNQNFCERITVNNPIQIMKRTDLPNVNLMGASAVFTALTSGGGPVDTPGFRNNVPYQLEFSVKRVGSAAEITCRFSDNDGWSIQHTATDTSGANFRFDGLAMRPNSAADSADTFEFSRCRAEYLPFEVRLIGIEYPTLIGSRITWSSLPSRSYRVERRAAFDPSETWTTLATIVAVSTTESFEDPDAFFIPQGFYRIVQLPDL